MVVVPPQEDPRRTVRAPKLGGVPSSLLTIVCRAWNCAAWKFVDGRWASHKKQLTHLSKVNDLHSLASDRLSNH